MTKLELIEHAKTKGLHISFVGRNKEILIGGTQSKEGIKGGKLTKIERYAKLTKNDIVKEIHVLPEDEENFIKVGLEVRI